MTLLSRYTVFALCVIAMLAAGAAAATLAWDWAWPIAGIAAALFLLGVCDMAQTRHSIQRNYPIIGHIRWMVEFVRPEIRQYLIEGDEEAAPFTRDQRSLIYKRAKGEMGEHPFGTLLEPYANGYEFIGHSNRPATPGDPKSFRIKIGGDLCAKPYSASIFNISAMSFGSLSANAIRALNKGAAMGGFSHDTGEGSISSYHRENGGDIVWEVASGYFGCRTKDGKFDPVRFAEQAQAEQIKMIEIKLSQGAKPGHGGVLPGPKVTREIAETRGVPEGVDCVSPARHSEFSTPLELMDFIARLREGSGGKPVGFKLCIGHPWEFMGMVKAMLQSGVRPDFIVVDGTEGGTGAAPQEFTDHIGAPMREGLLFVHNTLVGAGLRDQIRIGAAGKIANAFDIASVLAIGADWANAARGYMFALGCVQSLSCNTNHCPTGVATQDKLRQGALVVTDKAERVRNFHDKTVQALADILAAAGLQHPSELGAHHLSRRISATEIKQFSEIHTFLKKGELLSGDCNHAFYAQNWKLAATDRFEALAE
ncbi:FMN-binding glutamate synthase family protein [Caulobacter sp. S45]|uniref:FMN-binding glutamate synthase family protein n=1 Tax=Caulobacter sp. S45 TaxID=1641861 RepID=UPI00131D3961|nr:FMN-binding glutamate synthase family protein [Caulobacter sp. S45]